MLCSRTIVRSRNSGVSYPVAKTTRRARMRTPPSVRSSTPSFLDAYAVTRRAVVHLEAGGPRLRQELVGQAVGIELAGHGREQRRRAGEGEPVPDIALAQQLDLDAGRAAREPLALEHGAVAAAARQVEAPGRAPGAVVVARPGQVADAVHGIEAETVAPDRMVSADAIDQIDRGACRSRTGSGRWWRRCCRARSRRPRAARSRCLPGRTDATPGRR